MTKDVTRLSYFGLLVLLGACEPAPVEVSSTSQQVSTGDVASMESEAAANVIPLPAPCQGRRNSQITMQGEWNAKDPDDPNAVPAPVEGPMTISIWWLEGIEGEITRCEVNTEVMIKNGKWGPVVIDRIPPGFNVSFVAWATLLTLPGGRVACFGGPSWSWTSSNGLGGKNYGVNMTLSTRCFGLPNSRDVFLRPDHVL